MKKEKAITLISLVITIVVLIILSSIAIYLSLGNNGIFTKAKQAKEQTNKKTATEIINLKITNCQMNKYAEEQRMPTLKELSLVFGKDNEIEYVTQESKVASTEYDVPSENPSSIYTKLNDYPYEFEINSSLQLASINGIQIAKNQETNLVDYSKNEERIVGKWLDGKNIYERLIDIGDATQYGMVYDLRGSTQEVPIPYADICNNLDKLISGNVRVDKAFDHIEHQYAAPFSWSGEGSGFIGIYDVNYQKNIYLVLGSQYSHPRNKDTVEYQILIQYTKITD